MIQFSHNGQPQTATIHAHETPPEEPYKQIDLKELRERPLKPVTVPRRISKYHPLVYNFLQRVNKRTDHREPVLNINVIQKRLLHRAARIMDALIKALERESYNVEIETDRYNPYKGPTVVSIFGETVTIKLYEKIKQIPHVPTEEEQARLQRDLWAHVPKYDSVATGDLWFVIDEYAEGLRITWRDRQPVLSKSS